VTRCAMGQSPISRVQPDRLLLLVNYRGEAKRGRNERRNALTFFMYCVAVERSCTYTGLTTGGLEIQGKHVRGFDRLCRCESRTDRLAAAGESCEVMKVDPSRQKH